MDDNFDTLPIKTCAKIIKKTINNKTQHWDLDYQKKKIQSIFYNVIWDGWWADLGLNRVHVCFGIEPTFTFFLFKYLWSMVWNLTFIGIESWSAQKVYNLFSQLLDFVYIYIFFFYWYLEVWMKLLEIVE